MAPAMTDDSISNTLQPRILAREPLKSPKHNSRNVTPRRTRSTSSMIPTLSAVNQFLTPFSKSAAQGVRVIQDNQIGRNALFRTPFGAKAQCYTDFTASGKPLQCIEDFVQREVLPLYGNTHTSTSVTGLQMTSFREDARETIARAVNAKISGPRPTDCVLFTGQGTTSAVNKLVSMLDLARLGAHKNPERRPVVFVGPFEHHSNLLPWRESGAKVVIIPEGDDGKVCVATLAKELKQHAHRPLRIGAFSAASNLTGVLSDVDALCMVLHQHGALAFFDYATCGPYVKIDMNPAFPTAGGAGVMLSQYVYRDGIFLSGHKFVGGPGATGLLVVKSNLTELRGGTPTAPGGGTVLFVTHTDHRYLSHATDREEGGTPDILGNIRLGLAFQVKQRVGEQAILELEHANMRRAFASLSANENIVLLGRSDVDKLPIFSFLVRFHDRFLHYNFVCALLNDLFGVQSRGGCQCAGPYAARLLGIELDDLGRFTDALVDGQGALKPGFTRMSFPYFMDARELDYILDAVHFVATDGWKFLPQYRCDLATGSWTHFMSVDQPLQLAHLDGFASSTFGASSVAPSPVSELEEADLDVVKHREDNFQLARKLAAMSVQDYTGAVDLEASERLGHSYESLRWFAYSEDAVTMVKSGGDGELSQLCGPCAPHRYSQKKRSMRPVDDILENPLTLHRSSMNRGSLHHIQPQFSSDFQDFQDFQDTDVVDGSFSKRAALKTWVKRVITRDRQSSNARGSSLRHSLFG